MNRRDLIKGAVTIIPGTIALQMIGTKFAFAESGDFKNSLDVLNYALTLEYLEAEFYRQGNNADLLNGRAKKYLEAIEKDEKAHVAAIKSIISSQGETAVSAPEVDFGGAFKSKDTYLETAYTFENLGVGAYLGAAPSLFKDKSLLSAAASIFGIEARHAAILGSLSGKKAEGGVYMGSFETPKSKGTVLKAAAPFIVSAQTL